MQSIYLPERVYDGRLQKAKLLHPVCITHEEAQRRKLPFNVHDDGVCHCLELKSTSALLDEYFDLQWVQPHTVEVQPEAESKTEDRYAISFDYEDD